MQRRETGRIRGVDIIAELNRELRRIQGRTAEVRDISEMTSAVPILVFRIQQACSCHQRSRPVLRYDARIRATLDQDAHDLNVCQLRGQPEWRGPDRVNTKRVTQLATELTQGLGQSRVYRRSMREERLHQLRLGGLHGRVQRGAARPTQVWIGALTQEP